MKPHVFHTTTLLRKPIEEVFDFFSNAENLEILTPPTLHFHIKSPLPIHMEKGTHIEYTIKLHGIPLKWKTLISTWEPPFRFVDTQLEGPYKIWVHEHVFESQGTFTRMHDTVRFLSPGWVLEPILHHAFIQKKVEEIFDYRRKQLAKLF